MKEINLALTASFASEEVLGELTSVLTAAGVTIKNAELRTNLTSLFSLLEKNKDIDAVLISEFFDKKKLTAEDIERLQKLLKEDAVVIIVTMNEEKGGDFVRMLLSNGVNNAIFEDDADFEEIAERILAPKSRKEAMSYYGLSITGAGTPSVSQTDRAQQSARYIMGWGGSNQELNDRMAQVSQKLNATELKTALSYCSDEVLDLVERNPRYSIIAQLAREEKRQAGEANVKEQPTGQKASVEKVKSVVDGFKKRVTAEKEQKPAPEYGSSQARRLAFTSINKGVGCTYSAILCAYSLLEKEKTVAIVELDDQDKHFECLCRVVQNRADVDNIRSFSFGGVDYYFNMPLSAFEANFRGRYDYVIYDFGCVSDKVIERGVVHCDRVFVIGAAAEYRFQEIADFYQDVSAFDPQNKFIYLFADYENKNLGNIATIIQNSRLEAIERETNVFHPTNATRNLFRSYVCGEPERKNFPNGTAPEDQLTRRPAVQLNILSAVLGGICVLLALVLVAFIVIKNNEISGYKEDVRKYVEAVNNQNGEYENSIKALNETISGMEMDVAVLTQPVAAGTRITDDMVTVRKIHCDLDSNVFKRREEIVGKYAACNISAGVPVADYFLAEYVEEPMPLEVPE